MKLEPINSAPKDGTHILAANADNHVGFGIWNDEMIPEMTVVHYWDKPGEEGFYISISEFETQTPFHATHWCHLPKLKGFDKLKQFETTPCTGMNDYVD